MRLAGLSRLAVLPMAFGLVVLAPQQGAYAGATHAGRHHKHHARTCGQKDIACALMCDDSFRNLSKALSAAGLMKTLEGKGPYTLFAPDDHAFWKQPKGFMDGLLADKKNLKKVLTYHLVARKLTASELANMRSARTVEGDSVMLDAKDGKLEVDGALVTKSDINCSNGVIHVIDDVLSPTRGK